MNIKYTTKANSDIDIYNLYETLEWNNFLQLSREQLSRAMEQSFYVVYAYDGEKLVGTGRVVSDGIINAYICGLGVDPDYRKKGIGSEILNRMIDHCRNLSLHIQFFCEERLVPYYKRKGFDVFAVGMKAKEC